MNYTSMTVEELEREAEIDNNALALEFIRRWGDLNDVNCGLDSEIDELEDEISSLNRDVEQLEKENKELEGKIDELKEKNEEEECHSI